MNQEHLDYHRSKLIGRAVLYVFAGIVCGGLVGLSAGDMFRNWAQAFLPGAWLPQNRFAYAVIGAQVLGVAGLLRAVFEVYVDVRFQRIANHLHLTYVDQPRGEPLRYIEQLFDEYEISRIERAYFAADPKFGLMVASAYYQDEGTPKFAGTVALAMASSMDFPRLIALPQTGPHSSLVEWLQSGRIKDMYGEQQVVFNNATKFSKDFRVFGLRTEEIRHLLGGEVGDVLLRSTTWQLRCCSGCLALWDKTARINHQASIQKWINDLRDLAKRVAEIDPQPCRAGLQETESRHRESMLETPGSNNAPPDRRHRTDRPMAMESDSMVSLEGDRVVEFFRQPPPRKPTWHVRTQIGAGGIIFRMGGILFSVFALPFVWFGFQQILTDGSFELFLFASAFLLVGLILHQGFDASRRRTLDLLSHGIYCQATVLSIVRSKRQLFNKTHVATLSYHVGSEVEQSQLRLESDEAERLQVALQTHDTIPLLHHPEKFRHCLIGPQVTRAFGLKQ